MAPAGVLAPACRQGRAARRLLPAMHRKDCGEVRQNRSGAPGMTPSHTPQGETMKTIIVEAAITVPRVPNFVFYDGTEAKVSIADLSDAELKALAEAWTEALMERAEVLRLDPATPDGYA